VLPVTQAVQAAHVYRWTDRAGVVHYGDHAPPPEVPPSKVTTLRLPGDAGAIARLRIEADGAQHLAWADNRLDGPVEVLLKLRRGSNVTSDPPLPARATVPAHGTALVAVMSAADPTHPGDFELSLDSLPGDPSAHPRDVTYQLPIESARARVDQGYGGRFSHRDAQNLYAVDFAAPIGTPVLAARDGVVMQIEADYEQAGLNLEKYGGRANFIRIVHDDGTMALYAHLKPDGALARAGQRVRAGQRIGLSGNTGFTTGPHLHFAVQVNRGMRLESIPFRMAGPDGPLQFQDAR